MDNAGTRALMKKLTLVDAPDLSATFPKQRAARVIITLTDGRRLEHFAPYRKGDPEAPLTDADLNDKFMELAAPVIGGDRARSLMALVWNLDKLTLRDLKLSSDKP
jgi:2-methylcitrate dehydratase PrpD